MSTLPEGFWIGAATAAYQIEGATTEDGRGPSIWDTFSHTPGKTREGDTGDVANDSYHRLDEDLDLIRSLHLDAYRFSIAWPRIVPAGTGPVNAAGLDYYDRVVDGLLERGVAPVATLYHWDLPQALEDRGGWTSRETSAAFAEYAAAVGRRLGDRVRVWTTLNEPWCSAFVGHAEGRHAPGRTSGLEALQAVHHLNLAHGLGVEALRSVVRSPDAAYSVTHNLAAVYPIDPDSAEDRDAARRVDALQNRSFTEPQLRGVYSEDLLADTSRITDWSFVLPGDLERIHQPIDSLGINYYKPEVVGRGPERPIAAFPGADRVRWAPREEPLTEMGWDVLPTGLYDLLALMHERYPELDLMITENGAAYADEVVVADGVARVHDDRRVAYLRSHVEQALRALDDGLPLTAYFAWSLMDNFEWAHGYSKRFGITYVDYETQQRIVKDSGRWWAELARTRTLPTA